VAVEGAENENVASLTKVSDLGRYRLIAELARGGMGIVYLALVRGPGGFNKLFVVKELKAHLTEDANLVRMFLEEARLAAKLNHPNVVQTIEIGSDGNRHYIAMEHLDGQSLNRAATRARKAGTTFPFQYFLHVLVHMLEGLHYAHGVTDFDGTPMNLVHRDVSPHNVFVTYDGQVKVLDFGIAKALDSSNDTRTGVLKGKVAYMAPEQARGDSPDRRADVFSAGVMLFEAATGTRMWSKAQNDLQILHALMNGTIPRPREFKSDLDPAVERIILKALAVKREERYASAAEMQADVEALLKSLEVAPFSARDVGKFFADMFGVERARIKAVIDDQLRALRGVASGEYGTIDLPQLMSVSGPNVTPSGMLLRSGSNPAFDQPPSSRSDSSMSGGAMRPALGVTLASEQVPQSTTQPTGRKVPMAAVVGGAVLFLAVAGGLAMRRGRAPVATPSAPSAAPASAAPPATTQPTPKAPEPIRVTVTASPREARISVDDGAPQTGTLNQTFPRDGAEHTLHIDAAKYVAKALTFKADDDHTFDVSLEPSREALTPQPPAWRAPPPSSKRGGAAPAAAPPSTPPPGAAPPAPAPAPAAPPPAATTTSHARQQIDTHDPYAQ
jgi:serine/threonine-protein kinase